VFVRRLTFALPTVLIVAAIAASTGLTASTVVVKKTLTVSVNGSGRLVSSPRGINCFTVCSAKFRRGTNVRLVPIPNPGWQFSSWSGACRGAASCGVKMNSAHVVLVTFTQKPVQPPIPTGSYSGKTADNEVWGFQVVSNGGVEQVVNLKTGQMNESCNPPDYYLYGGNLSLQGPYALDSQGGFTIDVSYPNTVGSSASSDSAHITGHITTTGVAAGTYQKNTQFSTNGISYNCSTGVQSWTGSLTSG